MAIKIGHASYDENGNISGGVAGDQNGKEVCTRSWYNKPWSYVLRPKSYLVAEKQARAMEQACANDRIGYDQKQRNTLRTQAEKVGYDLSKITIACECDCSSLVSVCALAAGVAVPYNNGNAPTTSTMRTAFEATGQYVVLTDSRYLASDGYLMRGDILVAPGKHTAMALEDGAHIIKDAHTTTTKGANCNVDLRVLKNGCKGEDVRAMQRLLIAAGYSCGKCGADGSFGADTETYLRAYQSAKSLTVDGVCGVKTWGKLLGVS